MNREIKFRGKTIDGLWEYGSLWIEKGKYYINGTDNNWWEVIPETVGQFTGLYDKNGKEIYEGDILSPRDRDVLFVVIWDNDTASFKFKGRYGVYEIDESILSLEIVGNIHDNPELLEETK